METAGLDRTTKFLRYSLLIFAALFVLVYLIVALLRIRYPFELEWMEGAAVDHAVRLLSGQKLYVSPSLEFVPFIYTPFYYYLSTGVSKIMGIGFFPLRLLSLISSLGCFIMIFFIVKRETRSNFSGLIASCLFAATYRISGAWFDVGRADSLFLLLLLAGLHLVRSRDSSRSYVLAGALLFLSFLTKQTALIVFAPVAAYCILVDRRRSVYFLATVVALVGASTYFLDWIHNGWYVYYTFDLPQQHSFLKHMWVDFWTIDIMSKLPIAFAMSVFYFASHVFYSDRRSYPFYLLMLMGALAGAWLSRLHPGGYLNVLMPAYAGLSILFGLAVHRALELVSSAPTVRRKLVEACIYLVCIIQFALLRYDAIAQIPTEKDLQAGRAFVRTLTGLSGEVLVPYHGYLPMLAGHKCYAHEQAIRDVLQGNESPTKVKLLNEIHQALTERRFDYIVLDDATWFPELIERNYAGWKQVFEDRDAFWPVTGYQRRPEVIFVAKKDAAD